MYINLHPISSPPQPYSSSLQCSFADSPQIDPSFSLFNSPLLPNYVLDLSFRRQRVNMYSPQIDDVFVPPPVHLRLPLRFLYLPLLSHDFFDFFSFGLHLFLDLLQHLFLLDAILPLLQFPVDHLTPKSIVEIAKTPCERVGGEVTGMREKEKEEDQEEEREEEDREGRKGIERGGREREEEETE